MSSASPDAIHLKAIEILNRTSDGLSYRELLTEVVKELPEIPRSDVSVALGDLPRLHSQSVWRPKPGYFKIRGQNEGPTVYTRGRRRKQSEVGEVKPAWPEKPLPNRIENLLRLGFMPVGMWSQTTEGIECVYESEFDAKKALFAYVIGESVVYLGRPHRGANVPAARTGYVTRSIRNALNRDKVIKVYALLDWEPFEHKGLTVNVAAGIEDELVERMQPPWNNYPA
jgi:hypothetical protein